jgi:hypothetical protein
MPATEDSTEIIRRNFVANGQADRDLAADEGQRWTTDEMTRDFEVIGFLNPFVVVKRRSDGQKGTLEFTGRPKVYFGWCEHTP